MASGGVEKNKPCAKCGLKGNGICMCSGCEQAFCWPHMGEHRQELLHEIDILGQDIDFLQQNLSRQPTKHSLLNQIDQWEKESIVKIQVAAEAARADLREIVERSNDELETSLREMTRELCSSREL